MELYFGSRTTTATTLCLTVLVAGIIAIFAYSQNTLEVLFFTMCGGILLKFIVVEASRVAIGA